MLRVPTIVVLGIESLLHASRLLVEYVQTDQRDAPAGQNLLSFQLFCTLTGAHLLVDRASLGASEPLKILACALPSLGLIVLLTTARLYAYAVLLGAMLAYLDPCVVRADVAVVCALAVQMQGGQLRSNLLRVAALLALLVSSLATSLSYARYLAVLALELSSWATERYMLPWRVPAGRVCCGQPCRFLLGFVVGVHIGSGREGVRLAPYSKTTWWSETFRGVAVYGSEAYVRYGGTPSGVLCAYLDGLGLVPYRMIVTGNGTVVLHVVGFRLVEFDTSAWPEASSADSFAAASRFPFRRLLVGIFLRTSATTAELLF